MIPHETVDLILDTARIEDVVGDFLTLKRRGASFVACCPFHNEKTPSFYVTPSKGMYKCFGCGKGGGVVNFVMEHEHVSYVEALRYLAKKYNIEIQEEEESAEEIAARQHKESLLLVSEFAQKFFVQNLQSGEGRAVGLAYLHSRGMLDETIARNGLGWASSGRTSLVDAAKAAGYKTDYLVDAGLAIRTEDGRVIDKFYERVMFPIYSVSGRVIAYSGRTLKSDNPAKYVNSPDTELYKKSRELLGIYWAKTEISRLDRCYLVEGNVDVISMQQLGIVNVVASCGTALTTEQVRLIKRFSENLTIMYDGDSAGIKAALKGINLVLREGLNVRIVLLPPGEDPDSFARSHTLDEVKAYIAAQEKDFITFKTDLLLADAAGDPIKKAGLINDIADSIAEIPDPVKRSTCVEVCAQKFGIESQILFARIKKTRDSAREAARKEAERARKAEQRAEDGADLPPYEQPLEPMYPEPDYYPEQQMVLEDNKALAPVEGDMLYLLLNYGQETLLFETDSDFYDPDTAYTVCDFIRSSLENATFANSAYARVFDAYVAEYDAGTPQDTIVRHLLDSPDRAVAELTGRFSTDRYEITVANLKSALTSPSSWLTQYVPKTIFCYAESKLKYELDRIRHSLATASAEEQMELMEQMIELQKQLKNVKEKIGR